MAATSKLSEPKCHNWVKANIWKCLSDICYNNNIQAGGECSSCSTENVVVCLNDRKCNAGRGKCAYHTRNPTQYLTAGCPNRICHNIKQKIQAAHRFSGPSYKNTDAKQWCTKPWELAKCFMPPDGYEDKTSAKETDFNGINSVVINFKDFQAKISDDLSKKGNSFEKGREISRAVRHSPDLEIDDSDLQQYFIDLSNLLSDPKCLATDQDAQTALKKLKQLEKDTLIIGKDDVRGVLDDVVNAVRDKIRIEIDEQKKKVEEQKLDLLTEMVKSVNAIKDQEKLSLSEVKSALTNALHAIDEKVEKGTESIKEEVQAGAKQIEKTSDESVSKIKSTEIAVQSAVHEMIMEGKESIKKEVQAGAKQIEKTIDGSVSKIKSTEIAVQSSVHEKVMEGKKSIKEKVQTGTKQIEKTTDKSVSKIKSTEIAVQSAVHEKVMEGKESIKEEVQAGTKQIEKTIDESVSKIQSTEIAVQSAVHEKVMEGKESIKEEVQTGTNRIEKTTDDSVSKIKSTEIAVQSAVNEKVMKGKEIIDEEIQAGAKQIEKATEESLRKITLEGKSKELECLQSDLISLYRETCSTIPICPCLEEVDASMVEFYIPPYPLYSKETDSLKLMSKQRQKQITEESEVDTLSGMFVKKSKNCRNIYVTAEPGFGKTSLVKWLVLNWCQAHCPEDERMRSFNAIDVDYLKRFKFLFLVYLRGAAEKGDIDSMIYSQVIPLLGNKMKYTPEVLEDILLKEKCLIVLDGLDEWTSADKSVLIPKRSLREKSTYLTTSRPWKFSMLSLNSTQIDQHIQIKNLGNMSAKRLVQSLFSIFERKNCLLENMQPEIAAQALINLLEKKNLNAFLTTPFMLLQMGFVWNETTEIGNSFCEIYTEMIDVQLTMAEMKNPGRLEKFKNKRPTDLRCFESSLCGSYFDLMLKVGKLAFETLCSENAESTLVFGGDLAKKHLSGYISVSAVDILQDCLKIGVLSKQLIYSGAKRKTYTYSFHHKTIQEYFAAVFLQSMYEKDSHTLEVLKRKCQSVAAVLEMGNVFKFLSGFNPKIAKKVLQSLQPVINNDRNTERYRMEMPWHFPGFDFEKVNNINLIKSLQDMIVSCIIESTNNGQREQDLPLEDVIINNSCDQDSYLSALNILIKSNGSNIKSLAVNVLFSYRNASVRKNLKDVKFEAIHSVLSLYVDRLEYLIHMHHLLERSVQHLKCFKLELEPLLFDHIYRAHSEAMKSLMNLKEAKELQVLHIGDIQGNHDVIQMLLLCISNNMCLRDIKLHFINIGQERQSSNEKLELTHHSDLHKLSLNNVDVSQLLLNDNLKELTLGHVPVSQLQLNDHLEKLTLKHVPVSQIQLNDHLKELTLKHVPVSQLQLNDHLQMLTLSLRHVPVSQLQANDDVEELTLEDVQSITMNFVGSQHLCEDLTLSQLQLHNQPTPSNLKFSLHNVDRASSLTSCRLGGEVGTVIRDLATAPNLHELILVDLTSESMMILSETLSRLVHVAEINICNTDIGNSHFVLTPAMTNLHRVELFQVSMSSTTFVEFIDSVLKCTNIIHTWMLKCTVQDVSSSEQNQAEQDKMSLAPTHKEYISGNGMKTFYLIALETSNRTFKDFENILYGSPSPVTVSLEMSDSELVEHVRSSPFFTVKSEGGSSIMFILNR